jgi:hypothetical protein
MTPEQAARKMRAKTYAEEAHSDHLCSPPKGYEKLWKIPHQFQLALADIMEQRGVTPYANDEISLIVWNVIHYGAEFFGSTFDDFMEEVKSWADDQDGEPNGKG